MRQAFGERLRSAPGVVVTDAASCDASLYICGLPAGSYTLNGLRKQAEQIAQTYRDPAGVELADDSEIIRTAKRLSMGYYYQWEWPAEPDYEWMEKRQKWSRLCRWIIQDSGGKDFDTRGLVEAAARKEIEAGRMSNWVTCYAEWAAVEKRVTPTKKVTWVSEEPLRVCVAWAERYKPCIVWYDEEAVADKILEMGVRVIRAGEKVPDQYAGPIALSVTAHGGAGLNLQFWSRQVFTCVPANGAAWEQILGRTHRQGQQSDEVWAWVPQWAAPLRHPLQKAREDAAWIESSMGNKQKLLLATFLETCPTSGRVVSK